MKHRTKKLALVVAIAASSVALAATINIGTIISSLLGIKVPPAVLAALPTVNLPSSLPPLPTTIAGVLTDLGLPAPTVSSVPAATTLSGTSPTIDQTNVFFKPVGNGRSCASCHQASAGWSVTPLNLVGRFASSKGTDPIFKLVDGANSPNERTSTPTQLLTAYSMLLTRGVIRIGLPMPSVAEFGLISVQDPYGYASAQQLSLFRRPLPSTNLRYLSTVMWDGRETLAAPVSTSSTSDCLRNSAPLACFASINADLQDQANTAVKEHAQFATGLTAAQQQSVANFELSLSTAQTQDLLGGSLTANGGGGGPAALVKQPFYFGMNDVVAGDYRTGAAFNRNVFTIFKAWEPGSTAKLTAMQASIGRGEVIFNTHPLTISGVNGFNDVLGKPVVQGTCSSCHDTPNVGSASVPRLMNTGIAADVLRTPDLPLYTLKNIKTGATVQVSDPGYALRTGKWNDIGKFKVPGLRAVSAHPPYFHNGYAPILPLVVAFYDVRFKMGLNPQEALDLTAFLGAL